MTYVAQKKGNVERKKMYKNIVLKMKARKKKTKKRM